jgi:hypothetical protein
MYDEKRGLTPRVQAWESRGQTKKFASPISIDSIVPNFLTPSKPHQGLLSHS